MSKRIAHVQLVMFFTIFCFETQNMRANQSPGCSTQDSLALLKSSDPVYTDALELAQTLAGHGFVVKCVLQSKMVNLFDGQKGAALYRTDRGDFDALFLPTPQTFNALEPIEHRENGRYLYSFSGTPRWRSIYPIDSARPEYFVKYGNQLFYTFEEQLAKSLNELNATASSACPVTKPNGVGEPGKSTPGAYGNAELYTMLWPDGTVEFRPRGPGWRYEDGSLGMKWPWTRAVQGKLTIQGRRLDASAPPLRANIPEGYGDIGFQSTMLIFPKEGCWEVTGKVSDASLTFVTRVVKIADHD